MAADDPRLLRYLACDACWAEFTLCPLHAAEYAVAEANAVAKASAAAALVVLEVMGVAMTNAEITSRASLHKLQAATFYQNWRVVPIKPTAVMALAGTAQLLEGFQQGADARRVAENVWRAMVEAAPVPPYIPGPQT